MARVFAVLFVFLGLGALAQQPAADDLNQKISQFNLETATIADAVRLFGEPTEYLWGREKLRKENLPAVYLARFQGDLMALVHQGQVVELRFRSPGYKFLNTIGIGTPLDEVLSVLGPPKAVEEGEIRFQPGVLYKNKGDAYYSSREKGVRLFFRDNRVAEMNLSRKDQFPNSEAAGVSRGSSELMPFDDVRNIPSMGGPRKQVGNFDLSGKPQLLATLTFNQKTVWPEARKMPQAVIPDDLLKRAMNPGLGVRKLHEQGITGKGVAIGIIDQPLFPDHPEYAGKIAAYHDVGTGQPSSMHGPAVASLLAGRNTGTAPDAKLYFAAAPSWNRDAGDQAKALEWILERNRKLPAGQKIRVVSISGAPSGPGSPFNKNNDAWDKAVEAAEREGILVLDASRNHGILGSCWFDGFEREDPAKCLPGYPGTDRGIAGAGRLLVPVSPRTTAEEFVKGDFGYQYTGRGGASWTMPYTAGVLAMGWQLRPELTSKDMVDLLFKTACRRDAGTLVINPPAFVKAVRDYRK